MAKALVLEKVRELSLRDIDIPLKVGPDEAALARLDTIFPGPGGSAPEACAWVRYFS